MKKALTGLSLAVATALGTSSALADDTVQLGYVNGWADSVAATNVAAAVIEHEFDRDVELNAIDAAIMWQGVARGDLDVSVSAWLPVTHADYYERFQDQVEILGTNYDDAEIGLVVPEYVDVESIDELNDHVDAFDGTIVGIDAGAGIMGSTETAIEEYGLDFDLMTSSGAAMTAALSRAISDEEPVVVTGWLPHWKFAQWDLRLLDDPQGVFGDGEQIDTFANPDFVAGNPELAAFLGNFNLDTEQIGDVMLAIEGGEDADVAASEWVQANSDVVAGWLDN